MGGPDVILSSLDRAKTQWYHFTTIIIAGMGFFTDAYDLFVISTVTRLLGRIYYTDYSGPAPHFPGTLPANVAGAVNGVALCGTLVGQLVFGWLGDKLGRKKVYGWTLLLMIITSIASAMSFGSTAKAVMTTLCFFRFWLGVGIGGDYPLSATIMSEYANQKTRGAFIAAVFAMQGMGILGGATMSIIVSVIFRNALHNFSFDDGNVLSTPPEADYVWRIILAAGAIPAALTFYFRMKMPETARYTVLVAKNNKQAALDMGRVLQVDFTGAVDLTSTASARREYGLWSREFLKHHGIQLLGCTSTWFLLDIAFYSQNLFQKDIFSSIGWLPAARKMSALEEVFQISRAQALIALVSTVPGYWATVVLVDVIGRWVIQMVGFFFMTLFMLILTLQYYALRGDPCNDAQFCGGNHTAFLTLYSLTFFFANFGPNVTTFIIPAELFPARLRSTCHGISAAAGKAGAIVGAFGFLYAAQSQVQGKQDKGYPTGIGLKNSFLLLTVINAAGFFCTFLVPETNGRSLEDLSGENSEQPPADVALQAAYSAPYRVKPPCNF
ncbi:probable inorganic phosphate transporter 1-3 isoform X1 [Physcomitrium patens]|uniref:Major facilitator superfamily (MFS) profile domain-containing protein n=2 Tax=Physcomitrium patens TaxID=3218 RepID=A0A2K1L4B9_PHYPA|nr:probable inorganic phosphate transporter 1-3 isoform X1 [Physcomitrium patens]PNR60867.1 hypothetical protein PHYPA_003660 [Physcomitrium patens]|eukprot:XP_024369039.1 probable inorganic phosphate transporter 1-3 isoform X1 [Physcomitrella patens]